MTASVLVVAGTRPERIKLGPVLSSLRRIGIQFDHLWTGQHSDPSLVDAAGDLWPEPTDRLAWGSKYALPPAIDVWAGMRTPRVLLVQGDTDSATGAAAWGAERGVVVVHLEAGLRSWEPDLPEEANRRAIDRVADILLCPSPLSAAFAAVDAKPGARVQVVGQTGLDAALEMLAAVREGRVRADAWLPEHHLEPGCWVLVTLHRRALATDPDTMDDFVRSLVVAAGGMPVVWPMHPRLAPARALPGVTALPPLTYAQTLALLDRTPPLAVVTDSGGLSEECGLLGVPCVIARPATERWELLTTDAATLVPPTRTDLLPAALAWARDRGRVRGLPTPYGYPWSEPRSFDWRRRPSDLAALAVARAAGYHVSPEGP